MNNTTATRCYSYYINHALGAFAKRIGHYANLSAYDTILFTLNIIIGIIKLLDGEAPIITIIIINWR